MTGQEGAARVLAVPLAAAGMRLDRYLADAGLGSRAAVERLVAGGAVLVDGTPRTKGFRLAGGEEIVVEPGPAVPDPARPVPVRDDPGVDHGIRIAYEDESLLVVDKPAGLVVHEGAGGPQPTLVDLLAAYGVAGGQDARRPGVVHRLDRDTSGLLALSRTEEAFRALARLVRARALEREYVALVRGRPRSWAGRIEAPIGRDRRDPTRQSLDTDRAREAATSFETVELLAEHALLRVHLETGRMHQIRVHLAAIGLPVSGDPSYGVAGDLGLQRQFLHASRLAFEHPLGRERVEASSQLPEALEAALALARAR